MKKLLDEHFDLLNKEFNIRDNPELQFFDLEQLERAVREHLQRYSRRDRKSGSDLLDRQPK